MRRFSQSWPLGRLSALLALVLLVGSAALAAVGINSALELRAGENAYSITAWEARNLPTKWLYEIGELFRRERSAAEKDADIARFLELTRDIDALEAAAPLPSAAATELAELRHERGRLENRVEATIEARIARVLKEQGLTRSFLLISDVVWPPVDLEFTDSPHTLAVSPRDRIELSETRLLREDLDLAELEAIEEQLSRDGLSARAFPTGGIGAYPTILDYTSSYLRAVEIAAHEWTHNYLFFRPLGFNYYDSSDLRTMNETVADLVASEIAALIVSRWPLEVILSPAEPSTSPAESVDVGAELRRLRGEVEQLLADGLVAEAEALMEARRLELAERGVQIRKINQAYFAFTNLYAGAAGNPAAVNPIGPKLDELRRRSESLGQFVALVGEFTSVGDLDRTLAEMED